MIELGLLQEHARTVTKSVEIEWIFESFQLDRSNIQTNLLRIVKAKTALDSNLAPCHTGGTFRSWVGIE